MSEDSEEEEEEGRGKREEGEMDEDERATCCTPAETIGWERTERGCTAEPREMDDEREAAGGVAKEK